MQPAFDQPPYGQAQYDCPIIDRNSRTQNSIVNEVTVNTFRLTTCTESSSTTTLLSPHGTLDLQTHYQYTADLPALERCCPLVANTLPPFCCKIVTPLQANAWRTALICHPDVELQEYILNGISRGFRVGFDRNSHRTRPAQSNMPSTREHPEPVREYLQTEIEAGRVIGPLDRASFPFV